MKINKRSTVFSIKKELNSLVNFNSISDIDCSVSEWTEYVVFLLKLLYDKKDDEANFYKRALMRKTDETFFRSRSRVSTYGEDRDYFEYNYYYPINNGIECLGPTRIEKTVQNRWVVVGRGQRNVMKSWIDCFRQVLAIEEKEEEEARETNILKEIIKKQSEEICRLKMKKKKGA